MSNVEARNMCDDDDMRKEMKRKKMCKKMKQDIIH